MTNRKLYIFLINFLLIAFSIKVNAQLLDSIAIDTVPNYTLQKALNQDPLKVYKLNLKKLKLSELPPEILAFKNLQVLDISKNKFKVFPKGLTNFKYLQELDISANKIEIVPAELGALIHLKKFIANSNEIVSIPPEIRYLRELKILDLWGNHIGVLPYEINELENNLEEIDMRVILMSNEEHKKIQELLPKTKIRFSRSCNCSF